MGLLQMVADLAVQPSALINLFVDPVFDLPFDPADCPSTQLDWFWEFALRNLEVNCRASEACACLYLAATQDFAFLVTVFLRYCLSIFFHFFP